jgi:hypothetical protein
MNPDAKSVVTQLAKDLGMKEIAVVSRIYLWFSQQDEVIQKGVLNLLPKGYEADVCRLALERMAADAKPKK